MYRWVRRDMLSCSIRLRSSCGRERDENRERRTPFPYRFESRNIGGWVFSPLCVLCHLCNIESCHNCQSWITPGTMTYLLPLFKLVTLTFSFLSIYTALQAIFRPKAFSKQFGIPLPSNSPSSVTQSYITLLGARQLGTALILLVFVYQRKWVEAGTVLAIVEVVVAGTVGYVIAKQGNVGGGVYHALPGAGIAALGVWVVWAS